MIFEVGKYYKHTTGLSMQTLGNMMTTMWGLALIAEQSDGQIIAVGRDEDSSVNWIEISREEWLANFT
jgi:hypothetical protein